MPSLPPPPSIRIAWKAMLALLAFAWLGTAVPASAGTVAATFFSATTVPVAAASYTATGNSVLLTLNYTPATGTSLMVVKNTGPGFIEGTFSNLAQGEMVTLTYAGLSYTFLANYYGGSGNDLVLQWAGTTVAAWGWNTGGELGIGTTTSMHVPVTVNQTPAIAGRTVLLVAGGFHHSLALCADGTLAAWGGNDDGQLGINSVVPSLSPVEVVRTGALSDKTVIAIAAGNAHSLALCSDGTLAAWGRNGTGQYGNNSTTPSTVPVVVNTAWAGTFLEGRTLALVAPGESYTLGLCTDGRLAAWGDNAAGQLGNSSTTESHLPIAVDVSGALAGKTVVAVAAGTAHNLALCSDGTLVAWGDNTAGQLGTGDTTNSPVPVAVSTAGILGVRTVIAIAAGSAHSLALCSDGTLAVWGANAQGQLGTNSTNSSLVPVASNNGVVAGKTIVSISAGYQHSMALCSDGTLAAWGADLDGQLGNNSSTQSNVPVAVSTAFLPAGRRFAAAAGGHASSFNLALTGAPPPPPVVTTVAAGSLTGTTAVVNGTFNAGGNNTSVSFDYGLTTSYTSNAAGAPVVVTGLSDTPVSATLTGLSPKTTYHFRAKGTNAFGASFGGDLTFLTPSNNAKLSNLILTGATLSPVFAQATTSYTASVSNATTSVTITPTVADSLTTMKVNGTSLASGSPVTIPLAFGQNSVSITLTAQDATTLTYTVTVTRTLNTNANLASLTLSSGPLSPAFSGGTLVYTASVPNATTSVTVTAAPVLADASIKVNGASLASGVPSSAIALGVGLNTINIVATAQDGITTRNYQIQVTRPALPPTVINPTVANVGATHALLGGNVTGDGEAAVTQRGVYVGLEVAGAPRDILGPNVVKVPATGTTGVFTIPALGLLPRTAYWFTAYASNSIGLRLSSSGTFTTLSNNADLAGLTLSSGTLSPAFAQGTVGYTVTLANNVTSLNLTPTVADATATVEINGTAVASGTAGGPITVSPATSIISVVVKAQDTAVTKTYTIAINAPLLVVKQGATVLASSTGIGSSAGLMDLGGAKPGDTLSRVFTLTNTGKTVLNGMAFAWGNSPNWEDFSVPNMDGVALATGQSTTFTVRFTPSALGERTVLLYLFSNDPVRSPFRIQLRGTGVTAPAIATAPNALLAEAGQPAALTVAATGGALSYQWLKNKVAIPGATNVTFSLPSAAIGHAGAYSVKISNAAGSLTTLPVALAVADVTLKTVKVLNGQNLTLPVLVAGPGLSYKWWKGSMPVYNGADPLNAKGTISGAIEPKLTITRAAIGDAGTYTCVITMANPQDPFDPFTLTAAFTAQVTIPPVVNAFNPGQWIVGGTVTSIVTAKNSPTSFTVTGQPAGVTLDATGQFHGKPAVLIKTATTYRLTIIARNAAGASSPLIAYVTVQPMPSQAIGAFNGLVSRDAALNDGLGGTLSVNTGSTGAFTGRLTLGALSYPFISQHLDVFLASDPTATVTIARKLPLHNLTLKFTIYPGWLYGTVTDGVIATPVSLVAARNLWNATSNKNPMAATYTSELSLDPSLAGTGSSPAHIIYPQGSGYGTLTVTTGGAATWSGRMADGAVATASTTMAPDGEVPLRFALYSNTGSAQGWVQATGTDPGLDLDSVDFDWVKHAQTTATLNYKNGFPLHAVVISGGKYVKPTAASPLVMNISPLTSGTNAYLQFNEGGLAGLTYAGPPQVSIVGAAEAGDLNNHGALRIQGSATANSVIMSDPNPAAIVLKITATTGAFSGSFTLHDDQNPTKATPSLIDRAAAFSGVCITRNTESGMVYWGAGYFLLPQLQPHPGLAITAAPLLSGRVLLQVGQ